MTISADPDKYKYFSFGTGLDAIRVFSLSFSGEFDKSAIMFGADMRSSVNIDNRDLVKGPTQGLDNTTLTAEKKICYKFWWASDESLFNLAL